MTVTVQFETNARFEDGACVLALFGEIDLSSVRDVNERAQRLIADRPERFVLDLSATTFLDSAGINAIVGMRNATDALGISFQLRVGPPNVMRVLEIVGLLGAIETTA
jgi:anti-sigma B factor antagonist